jgi:hypothetical protein
MAKREMYVSVDVEADGPIPARTPCSASAWRHAAPPIPVAFVLDDAVEQAEMFQHLIAWKG